MQSFFCRVPNTWPWALTIQARPPLCRVALPPCLDLDTSGTQCFPCFLHRCELVLTHSITLKPNPSRKRKKGSRSAFIFICISHKRLCWEATGPCVQWDNLSLPCTQPQPWATSTLSPMCLLLWCLSPELHFLHGFSHIQHSVLSLACGNTKKDLLNKWVLEDREWRWVELSHVTGGSGLTKEYGWQWHGFHKPHSPPASLLRFQPGWDPPIHCGSCPSQTPHQGALPLACAAWVVT
jgi:hypothetical protein